LAAQSYGDAAKQMIASAAPQLGWLLLPSPAEDPPSGPEAAVEQPIPLIASAPQAASAQAGAVALTASEAAASTAPAAPSPEMQQLETMAHDLAIVRQSVEQLAAGQEQMARDIANLQTAGQDIRRRIAALPPAAVAPTVRKPVPQSALAASVAPLSPAPPDPAPASSAASLPPPEPPLRPPMPVR
jgi:hypothetical protein